MHIWLNREGLDACLIDAGLSGIAYEGGLLLENSCTREKLLEIYGLMYSHFGPRRWWPAEEPFEVIIGAILTQFVSWKNAAAAIDNLKRRGLLSIDGICAESGESLEELIKCTRFYKQKARKLKVFCMHLKERYGGKLDLLFDKDIWELRRELLSLYGIGEETADSIILYAAEKPIFVVDAYTRRIFGRLGIFKEDITYGKMQMFFMEKLEPDVRLYNEYHALIDGVGNSYCSAKNPLCGGCPLNCICASYAGDLT